MAGKRSTARGLALATGVVLMLAGCGNSTDGTPTASSTATGTTAPKTSADSESAIWDPCSLPDSAISAIGMDPATKEKDVAGVKFTGWKVCTWRATARWYDLVILSGTPTLQDIQRRTDYTGFKPETVAGRQAIEYVDGTDPDRLGCYIAVQMPYGSAAFKVFTRYEIGKQGDPCAQARRHAEDLAKYLPAS